MATNALSTQIESLRTELEAKKDNIFSAAAVHIRPERFIEQVARACIKNTQLLECTRASLFMSAAQAASLGLEIDGVLGHAYLVPFRNKGTLEAVLVPGYLGLKELAYRSGMISSLEYAAVYPDDEFDYEKGTSPWLKHKPSDSAANGSATHVYAIIKTTTGGVIFEVMSWAQVEKHRNKFAKGIDRRDSPWNTNPLAMALKTVLRKALKLAPLNPELQRLMQHEELAEQPSFPSGTEAPVEDLDAAAELLEVQAITTSANPMAPTPE
jgi:recombination protein RecT